MSWSPTTSSSTNTSPTGPTWKGRVTTVVVVLFVMVGVAWAAASVATSDVTKRTREIGRELDELRQRNLELEQQNDRLSKRIDALRVDPRMLEKLAREEYGLIAPGETVYLFPPENPGSPSSAMGAAGPPDAPVPRPVPPGGAASPPPP